MLEQPSSKGRKSTKLRWIIGAVIIPTLGAIIGAGGLNLSDWLYPKPPPSIELPKSPELNKRLTRLENQMEIMVSLLRDSTKSLTAKSSETIITRNPMISATMKEMADDYGYNSNKQAIIESSVKKSAYENGVAFLDRKPNEPSTEIIKEVRNGLGKEGLLLPGAPSKVDTKIIEIRNFSKKIGRKAYIGKREWEWTIYLISDQSTLQNINCVKYTLHPTFPKPVWEFCGEENKGTIDKAYPLTMIGWGTFTVDVLISFKDGTVLRKKHRLVFES